MKHRKKVWGFGLVLLSVAACAPTVRELGDEPVGGSHNDRGGSGGTNNGGSGAVLPRGGSQSRPTPTTGGDPSFAGAAPDTDCFTPTHRLDLAQDPNGIGCLCDTADPYCVRDDSGEVPWIGQLSCESGRWKSVPPSCDQDCFSPTNRPDLAVEPGFTGCACDAEPPECVLTEHDGEPWRVALYCEEGRWVSAEDGVCGDGGEADCRVDGVTYPHGARRVPSPHDCNTCVCDDGNLICTELACSDDDLTCPEGTSLASRCFECDPPLAECTLVETSCFTESACPNGDCDVECE